MNPFIAVWKEPKNTIRYMIDNKKVGYGVLLVILSAISTAVFGFADTGLLASFSLPVILLLSMMVAVIIGFISWGIAAVFYTWIGKLLGGKGTIRNMSFAVAASLIPSVWTMPLGLIAVVLYGKDLFNEPVGNLALTNMSFGFYALYNLLLLATSIYGLVILSKGIGIVHNFSTLRGLGTIMIFMAIGFLFLLVVLALLFVLLMYGLAG